MSVDICPAILAKDPHRYRELMEEVVGYASRVHIDLADGKLTPSKTIALSHIWWPGGLLADLHVMYERPFEHTAFYVALKPQLVIVHAEAEGDFVEFARELHSHGIEAGVALLAHTPPQVIEPAIDEADHVLIFSGQLGSYGGQANLELLDKVALLRQMKPTLEIGWDGGANDQNVQKLVESGIDVINSGGFILESKDSKLAYAKLKNVVGGNDAAAAID